MITVSDDPVDVEMALGSGALSCPRCSARLAPWGSARPRLIRHGIEEPRVVRAYRPRRARCSGCRVTHVLLDVRLASRRADAAEVIAASVERKVALGWGHRKIGAWLGRPETTVRGWLRAFARSASRIAERFTLLVVRDAPDAVTLWPRPSGSLLAAALSALHAYAEALGRRFGVIGSVAWVRAGIAATDAGLFTSRWVAGAQHEPALPPVALAG